MKLVTGEIMCDIDGCVSLDTQMKITTYLDGTQLCKYHTYLAKEMSLIERSEDDNLDENETG